MTPSKSESSHKKLAQLQTSERNDPEALTDTENANPSTKSFYTPAMESEASSSTFTFFARLPAEVQLAIWTFAAEPEPRDIQVMLTKETINGVDKGYLKAITPPPAILHTCHDARIEGLKTHTTMAFKRMSKDGKDMIYSTPELDTIICYLPEWTCKLCKPYGLLAPTTTPWQDSSHEMLYVQLGIKSTTRARSAKNYNTIDGGCLIISPLHNTQVELNHLAHPVRVLRRIGNRSFVESCSKWRLLGWQAFWYSLVTVVDHMSLSRYLYWSHTGGGEKIRISRGLNEGGKASGFADLPRHAVE